jgi:hypothetical protein
MLAPMSTRLSTWQQIMRKILVLTVSLTLRATPTAMAGGISEIESYTRHITFKATTKQQQMPDVAHLIKIQATPERVYQTIATVDGISNWWSRDEGLGKATDCRA